MGIRGELFTTQVVLDAAGDEQEVRKLKLNPDVVKERLKGLEWIFSKQKDWFEITLD